MKESQVLNPTSNNFFDVKQMQRNGGMVFAVAAGVVEQR
jgi:hypothetical protein